MIVACTMTLYAQALEGQAQHKLALVIQFGNSYADNYPIRLKARMVLTGEMFSLSICYFV